MNCMNRGDNFLEIRLSGCLRRIDILLSSKKLPLSPKGCYYTQGNDLPKLSQEDSQFSKDSGLGQNLSGDQGTNTISCHFVDIRIEVRITRAFFEIHACQNRIYAGLNFFDHAHVPDHIELQEALTTQNSNVIIQRIDIHAFKR